MGQSRTPYHEPKGALYRVTLHCVDGAKPAYSIWAATPEHAKRKAMLNFSEERVLLAVAEKEESNGPAQV